MLKNTSDLSCREDGFTLIELLIVIVIIGILAAIAIPVFLNQAQSARNASVQSDVRNAASKVAQEVAVKGFPTITSDVTALEGKLIKSNGNNIKVASAANGNYTVTGWNDDTEKYTVIFTSVDGKFTQDTTSTEAASTNGANGGSGSGGSNTSTPVLFKSWDFENSTTGKWSGPGSVISTWTGAARTGNSGGTFSEYKSSPIQISEDLTGLTVGATYTFKGYMHTTTGAHTVNVGVNSVGATSAATSTTTLVPVNTWTEVTHTFTATATSQRIFFQIKNNSSTNNDARIDDFSITKL